MCWHSDWITLGSSATMWPISNTHLHLTGCRLDDSRRTARGLATVHRHSILLALRSVQPALILAGAGPKKQVYQVAPPVHRRERAATHNTGALRSFSFVGVTPHLQHCYVPCQWWTENCFRETAPCTTAGHHHHSFHYS